MYIVTLFLSDNKYKTQYYIPFELISQETEVQAAGNKIIHAHFTYPVYDTPNFLYLSRKMKLKFTLPIKSIEDAELINTRVYKRNKER